MLYNNNGYLPDYSSIQYQRPTLIAKSTIIPNYNTPFKVMLPQSIITYPRFIILIGLKLKDGASRTDLTDLSISNLSLHLNASNDRVYASMRHWWAICWQSTNNIYCATTQKSTSTGTTITMPQDNFLTIEHSVSVSQMQIFEVNFSIF